MTPDPAGWGLPGGLVQGGERRLEEAQLGQEGRCQVSFRSRLARVEGQEPVAGRLGWQDRKPAPQ